MMKPVAQKRGIARTRPEEIEVARIKPEDVSPEFAKRYDEYRGIWHQVNMAPEERQVLLQLMAHELWLRRRADAVGIFQARREGMTPNPLKLLAGGKGINVTHFTPKILTRFSGRTVTLYRSEKGRGIRYRFGFGVWRNPVKALWPVRKPAPVPRK